MADFLPQLLPVLLQTVERQSAQLKQARDVDKAWRASLDTRLADILELLKSVAKHGPSPPSASAATTALNPASHTPSAGVEAPAATGSLNYFLSHYQATGSDQVGMLQLELEKLGLSCWLDNKAEDLTKAGEGHNLFTHHSSLADHQACAPASKSQVASCFF